MQKRYFEDDKKLMQRLLYSERLKSPKKTLRLSVLVFKSIASKCDFEEQPPPPWGEMEGTDLCVFSFKQDTNGKQTK